MFVLVFKKIYKLMKSCIGVDLVGVGFNVKFGASIHSMYEIPREFRFPSNLRESYCENL